MCMQNSCAMVGQKLDACRFLLQGRAKMASARLWLDDLADDAVGLGSFGKCLVRLIGSGTIDATFGRLASLVISGRTGLERDGLG